jgi:hypothetical protein
MATQKGPTGGKTKGDHPLTVTEPFESSLSVVQRIFRTFFPESSSIRFLSFQPAIDKDVCVSSSLFILR